MPVSSIAVANFFVEKSINTGIELTPMKVIKMVYIAHGWYLCIKDKPLIDEAIEAWKYGPVVPTVYEKFRSYRDQQITKMAQFSDCDSVQLPDIQDHEIIRFLENIWEVYSGFTGLQLSTITHQADTPWYKTWLSQKGNPHIIIPNDTIKDHYRKLAYDRNRKRANEQAFSST